MIRVSGLLLMTVLALTAGCPDKSPRDSGEADTEDTPTEEPPSPTSTDPTAATPTPQDPSPAQRAPETGESSDTGSSGQQQTMTTYVVFDNGRRCVTSPCPSWTAIDPDGKEVDIHDVDFSPLNMPRDKENAVRSAMAGGTRYRVKGEIVEGPSGPAGEGQSLRVTEISGTQPGK